MLTFDGLASQRVTVHVIGNRFGAVTLTLQSADRTTVLTTTTSTASTFNLPETVLPSTGRYAISIDPQGAAVGTLNVAVTSRQPG